MGSDEWLKDFSQSYKKDFGWPFIARIMPKFATEDRLKMLRDCGLKYVSIGLQGSERMNSEIYNRKETNESFVNACNLMSRLGIVFVVDVILDVVYEKEDDLREVARTLNQLSRPFKVLAYAMTPFPGSDFYDRVVKDGLLDNFGADAYESMFRATKTESYKTPLYWRHLIQHIIPLCQNDDIDNLIESGPNDKASMRMAEKLYKRSLMKMKIVERFRQLMPAAFTKALSVSQFINHKLVNRRSVRNRGS